MSVWAAGIGTGVGGCREAVPEIEVVSLEGRIEKVERTSDTTGKISVLYYSDKHKQEVMGVGEVTTATEILINGAVARLADLKEGDKVRGEVRVVKHKGERTTTAIKIYVDRPVPMGGG
jgi:transcription termination factor Rho